MAYIRPCPARDFAPEGDPSGYGAAWLARPSGGRKVAGSNPASPTNTIDPAVSGALPPATFGGVPRDIFGPVKNNSTQIPGFTLLKIRNFPTSAIGCAL